MGNLFQDMKKHAVPQLPTLELISSSLTAAADYVFMSTIIGEYFPVKMMYLSNHAKEMS